MFNASGHLGDYFNGFLPNHVLTVTLNTFKLPLSPMLKSNGETGKFSCEMREEADDKRLHSK